MSVGSITLEFALPERPKQSQISDDAFRELVHKKIKQHLEDRGFVPARYTWVGHPHVPDDPSDAPEFVGNCIGETGLDSSLVEAKPVGGTTYCIAGTSVVCYQGFSLGWNGPEATNPFNVVVALPNGKAVVVALTCVLTIDSPGVFR